MRGLQLSPRIDGLAVCQLAVAAFACGGDAVEPTFPDVSGFYQGVTIVTPRTCTDPLFNRPGFTTASVDHFEQSGAELTVRAVEIDGQNVEHLNLTASLTLDGQGRFQLDRPPSPWAEVVTPDGSVFMQSRFSGSGRFLWAAQPITLTGSGSMTEEYRETSPTGPVLTTCTMQQTNTATRTDP